MPKIFISHSWDDNDIARKIAEYLKRDGAEIWIDYTRISGGESLPERIGYAIEWCDTLVLIWSTSAASSYFVKLEWMASITNQKRLIPCIIDDTKLPSILSGFLYIDFKNYEQGYRSLARALNLVTVKEKQTLASKKFIKKPSIEIPEKDMLKFKFRSNPSVLSIDDIKLMLKKYDFFDKFKNEKGHGFYNQYSSKSIKGGRVVIDYASNLIWQQSGSPAYMDYENAKEYISQLNRIGYAGYYNWRLPTAEEAMSLMERKQKHGDLYIDPIFDVKQHFIWTSDLVQGEARAWIVDFFSGITTYSDYFSIYYYVRAVSSGQ